MPSSSGRTAVESTTVESVKSKPAVAPATAEPNAVAPVVATQAAAAAPPLKRYHYAPVAGQKSTSHPRVQKLPR